MLLCISAIPAMILFLKQMATHQKSNFVPEATPIQNSFPLYDTGLHDEMITLHGAGNLTLWLYFEKSVTNRGFLQRNYKMKWNHILQTWECNSLSANKP